MKTTWRAASFGPYTLDLRSGELRKFGTRVNTGEQALQILLMLLESPGEMVTREELRSRLWPENNYMDFDHGLNSAVQRLRDCLSDSAAKPRWIETIPRRGYRFVGQVDWSDERFPSGQARPSQELQAPDGNGDGPFLASQDDRTEIIDHSDRIAVARKEKVAGSLFVVAIVALASISVYFARHGMARKPPEIHSLAVLPLANLSGDSSQDYFSDAITEELITQLGKIRSIRVISRTSVMQYRGTKKSLADIARELNVDAIVEGTVTRASDRVHMTANFVQASPEKHLWAESYDTPTSSIFSLQGRVALAIAGEIQVQVTTEERGRLVATQRVDPEAYDLYSRGRYVARTQTAESFQKAVNYYQKAIQKDPTYAAAYAALGAIYAQWVPGENRPRDRMPMAREYARKAWQLDPTLAEAHSVLGTVELFYDWNWSAAEEEFKQTIEFSPNDAWAHRWHARWLVSQDRTDEAIAEANLSLVLDPSPDNWDYPIWIFVLAGKADLAARRVGDLLELEPNNPWGHFELAQVYGLQGKREECAQEYLRADELFAADPDETESLRRALASAGANGYWRERIESYKRSAASSYVPAVVVAAACMRIDDRECAFRWLKKGFAERDDLMINLKVEHAFDNLRSDAHFQDLIRRVGIPN